MTSPNPTGAARASPAIRVLPETRIAMKEVIAESG
jgi:hypothetical protein